MWVLQKKKTAILAKGSKYYSQQNEDTGGGICVEEVPIIKIRNKETQTDEPRDIILQKLEEFKKYIYIQILKEVNLLRSGKFQKE